MPSATLAGLVDLGLVSRTGDGRCRLLETVKLFARQRWPTDAYLEGHVRWCVEHLRSVPADERFTSLSAQQWSLDHYDDHRAVEDRLAATGRTSELAELIGGVAFGYENASPAQAFGLIERSQSYLERFELSNHQAGLLHLATALAALPARQPATMASASAAAVELLDVGTNPAAYAMALIASSWIPAITNPPTALERVEVAFDVSQTAGLAATADHALGYWASHLALSGRQQEAAETLDRLQRRASHRPDDVARAISRLTEVEIYVLTDPQRAHTTAEEIRSRHTPEHAGWSWIAAMAICAGAACIGDITQTQRHLTDAEQMLQRESNDTGLPDQFVILALLAHHLGHDDTARTWLTTVRTSARPTSNFLITRDLPPTPRRHRALRRPPSRRNPRGSDLQTTPSHGSTTIKPTPHTTTRAPSIGAVLSGSVGSVGFVLSAPSGAVWDPR